MHRYLLGVLLALMVGGCAAYTATSGQVVLKDDSKTAEARIGSNDRRLIEEYDRNHADHKAATSSARVVIGHVLPAGTKSESLSRELEQKLSPLPSSHVRLRVGQDVVLVDSKTRVIVDVLYGAAK